MSKRATRAVAELIAAAPSRRQPAGVEVRRPIDLGTYLPFRLYRLVTRIGFLGGQREALDLAAVKPGSGGEGKRRRQIKIREWRMLALLGACGPMTHSEITALAGMDAATVTRAVRSLQDRGWLDTRRSLVDRRKHLILLTADGAQIHDAISAERHRFVDDIEATLEPGELEELLRLLDKLDLKLAENFADTDPGERNGDGAERWEDY